MSKPTGIAWIGPVSDIGGYGNVSRNFLRCLDELNIPVHIVPIGGWDQEIGDDEIAYVRNLHQPVERLGDNPYLIIHATPDSFPLFRVEGLAVKKRIGMTIFETDRIPQSWVAWCNEMDEIWLPSRFNLETFSRSGVRADKLRLVPYPIRTESYERPFAPYPFPDDDKSFKFLYNCAFSFRKGLDLLVESFCLEFGKPDNVSLILKMYVPPWSRQWDVEALIQSYIPQKQDAPPIRLIVQKLHRDALYSLYQSVDCYVSTDRANGWGMPCMEMMAMGKPAITIDWSGSTEFMNDRNAFLIEPEDELEDVNEILQHTQPALYAGHRWAKVTADSVRRTLREAYRNEDKRNAVARQAKEDMQNRYSIDAIARIMANVMEV